MDKQQNTPLPPTAHVSAHIGEPVVRPINGYPGRYAIDLSSYGLCGIHATADQWDRIDTAVRAGIAAAQQKAAS